MDFAACNLLLEKFHSVVQNPIPPVPGQKLFTGVDLGTAYIVLAVVDDEGQPIAGAYEFAQVVKDGLVVDFTGAVRIVKKLKAEIEEKLGVTLLYAATAYPPETGASDMRAINYVAEAAGFEVISSTDEPTAANAVLGVEDGGVVDIGGGTTGTAIFEDGQVIHVADDPTGGTQFSLVIAGGLKVPFEKAEEIKKDPNRQDELQPLLKPVMQKVASIVRNHVQGYAVNTVYLVGGTSSNKYIDRVLAEETGLEVLKPSIPFLVTPLGIALHAAAKHKEDIEFVKKL